MFSSKYKFLHHPLKMYTRTMCIVCQYLVHYCFCANIGYYVFFNVGILFIKCLSILLFLGNIIRSLYYQTNLVSENIEYLLS